MLQGRSSRFNRENHEDRAVPRSRATTPCAPAINVTVAQTVFSLAVALITAAGIA